MELTLPELEQRLSNLQSQVERLWHKAERNVPPVEQRLLAMADQYADYLQQWAATVERHAQAVKQLESYISEWEHAGTRVQEDASQRLQELESLIKSDWDALRHLHDEPIRELREQATSLTRACLTTATAAQKGLELTEARLATLEEGFQRRMTELTRELQSAVAEIKAHAEHQPARLAAAGSQWSLDDVTRLHSQIRDSSEAVGSAAPLVEAHDHPATVAVSPLPRVSFGGADADADARHPEPVDGATVAPSLPGRWRAAAIAATVVMIVAAVFLWRLQNQVRAAEARAEATELQSRRAAEEAARAASAAREEAAREISGARELANQAQRIGSVLAAPDLVRYNLFGAGNAPRASGQALWSRSRGFVFSGSGLPAPPANTTYQVWLLTRVAAVKAGTLAPDPNGTVTVAQEPPAVPRAVVGVMVTAEPAGAGETPSGTALLTSIVRAPEPPVSD